MKKVIGFICILISMTLDSVNIGAVCDCDINVAAESSHTNLTPYNWYCKKSCDNSQARLDSLLSFTEKDGLESYYLDKMHNDFES